MSQIASMRAAANPFYAKNATIIEQQLKMKQPAAPDRASRPRSTLSRCLMAVTNFFQNKSTPVQSKTSWFVNLASLRVARQGYSYPIQQYSLEKLLAQLNRTGSPQETKCF